MSDVSIFLKSSNLNSWYSSSFSSCNKALNSCWYCIYNGLKSVLVSSVHTSISKILSLSLVPYFTIKSSFNWSITNFSDNVFLAKFVNQYLVGKFNVSFNKPSDKISPVDWLA